MKRFSNISIYIAIFLILFRGIAFAASGTIYANGDITTTNWTSGTCTTNLYSCISEGTTSPNDTNYIQTPNGVTATYVYTNTASPADVQTVTAMTITVRADKTGGRSGTLDVYYSTDGTDPTVQIGSTVNLVNGTLTDHTFSANGLSLTKTQIDALRIKYVATLGSTGGGGGTAAMVTASQTDLTYTPAPTPTPSPSPTPTPANPVSTNYQLLDFGFGAGGSASSSSTNYMFQGILGEIETASLSSTNYLTLPGLTYTLEPNTPLAPIFTNPSGYYNKLHIVIDNGANPTDATYVIQVSTDPTFSTNIYFVQADDTLGTKPVFQNYTLWGSTTGFDIIGLTGGTTYYARVAARTGAYQQGFWSQSANSATTNPTLIFSVQTTSQSTPPFNINLGSLTPGSISTSSDKVTTNITTNAVNGGLIYIYGSNNGLKSISAGNYTINSTTNDLSTISEGYGLQGTSTTQTSGGPMVFDTPYAGTGNNVGVIDTSKRTLSDSSNTPVTGGQASFELKAKASSTTPTAGDYTDLISLIATGSF